MENCVCRYAYQFPTSMVVLVLGSRVSNTNQMEDVTQVRIPLHRHFGRAFYDSRAPNCQERRANYSLSTPLEQLHVFRLHATLVLAPSRSPVPRDSRVNEPQICGG